ncbi:Hypothetical protein SCF082_LOCUS25455, partial [Durusdinium trenchii]
PRTFRPFGQRWRKSVQQFARHMQRFCSRGKRQKSTHETRSNAWRLPADSMSSMQWSLASAGTWRLKRWRGTLQSGRKRVRSR